MTVKIYISKDSTGQNWAPDYPHEIDALQYMIKKLWQKFHHIGEFYAVFANVRDPSADLVIFSERGLGVLELKGKAGLINIHPDGLWFGNTYIEAGVHKNPHQQVQAYAQTMRDKILPYVLPDQYKRDRTKWNDVKSQTGVVFTDPRVDLTRVREQINGPLVKRLPWEDQFSILQPDDIVSWAARLRFVITLGHAMRFEPFRVKPMWIEQVLKKQFGAVEWDELEKSLPPAEVYGYLILEGDKDNFTYSLNQDLCTLGRSPDCEVVFPDNFNRVSKKHAQITRGLAGVEFKDIGSSNGSYLGRELIKTAIQLDHGQVITLGGPIGMPGTCTLHFEFRELSTIQPESTEMDAKQDNDSSQNQLDSQ